jgi:hypothetical protein
VFAAGTVCVVITFVLMLLIEERPLRGGTQRPPVAVE